MYKDFFIKHKYKIITVSAILLLVVLTFLFINTNQNSSKENVQRIKAIKSYNEGRKYLEQNAFSKALEKFNDTYQLDPQNIVVLTDIAITHRLLGNNDQAIKFANKAVKLQSKLANTYIVLTDLYNSQEEYNKAIEMSQRAYNLTQAPSNRSIILNYQGYAYLKKKNFKKAKASITESLQIKPDYISARNNLGLLYIEEGQLEKALKQFQSTLELSKNNPDTQYYQAKIYYLLGQKDKALSILDRIKHFVSEYYYAHYLSGIIYAEQNLHDKAISSFTESLKIQKVNIGPNTYRETLLTMETKVKKLLETYANNANLYILLGSINTKLNKPDKTLTIYNQAINKGINDPDIYNNIAIVYSEKNEDTKAINYFKKAINISPKEIIYHYGLANTYKKLKKYDLALKALNKCIEISPNFSLAEVNIGNIYKAQKDYENAIVHYRKAITINPAEAYAYLGLGEIYQEKNLMKDAKWNYKMFLRYAKDSTTKDKIQKKLGNID